MNTAEFVLENVVKRFGSKTGHVAVDHVSTRFSNTQAVGIIGESGSGKSTLGRMLCGLEIRRPARSGSTVRSSPTSGAPDRAWRSSAARCS